MNKPYLQELFDIIYNAIDDMMRLKAGELNLAQELNRIQNKVEYVHEEIENDLEDMTARAEERD